MSSTESTNGGPFDRLRAVFVHVAAYPELALGLSGVHVLHSTRAQVWAAEDADVRQILLRWASTLSVPSSYVVDHGRHVHVQGHLVDGTFIDMVGVLDDGWSQAEADEFAAAVSTVPQAVQS